ncbi:primosomal protein N' [Puniceicoccaceae bacterium K14]|nr:primosomal protein N' [Puniceicoccaceae bacterium K14]
MNIDDRIVSVWLFSGLEKELHYIAPKAISNKVAIGSLVKVPVGGRRQVMGIVNAVDCRPEIDLMRLKAIGQLVYPHPILNKGLLDLCEWTRNYYACSRESVLEAMVPAPVRDGMAPKVEKHISVGTVMDEASLEELRKRARKQAELYEIVQKLGVPQKKSDLLSRYAASPSACKALVDKGILKEVEIVKDRVAYEDEIGEFEYVSEQRVTLNEEQAAAVDSIEESRKEAKFIVHLLQGVTGSGKTEVYLSAMENALRDGKSVLFLVPEVALTPQTVGRLRSRLADRPDIQSVVWHSHLSAGERMDAWMACATGKARVVVGARSAVFAPLQKLGLIIVDEEHEPAYKQDESPRYHGRDIAVYRGFLEKAVCVLGSATPSLESYQNALKGKYRHDRLTKRIDDRSLPMIHIVDMRGEMMRSKKNISLSSMLVEKLRNRFENGEQSILFINRRGFSASMICQECGHVPECKHCSVTMTYHRFDETIKCHMCGHEEPAPHKCPECNDSKIRWKGLGTQRIEEAVKTILPMARTVRIDTDTMTKKYLFREILGKFRSGKIDILIGTQMIAKGLDFPNVTLVGLVDADLSMHVPDFRAHERTFQLLVQVSGRAGRGDLEGEVVVQTFTPHADPIQFARQADVDHFLEMETQIRQQHNYPPNRHLIRHLFRGPNPDKVAFFAEQFAKRVKENFGDAVELRGPVPCSIEKIKDHYRFQIWYFTNKARPTVAKLREIEASINWPDDVIQVIDVDAYSLG